MSENSRIYDDIERKRAVKKKEDDQQLKNQIKGDATNRALGIRKRNQSSLFDSLGSEEKR
jgi:flagellar motility protein MotE (MotC chaperone)